MAFAINLEKKAPNNAHKIFFNQTPMFQIFHNRESLFAFVAIANMKSHYHDLSDKN